MNIVQTINIPTPPSSDLGFYERTNPECVLTSPLIFETKIFY